MKRLDELGISPAPWEVNEDGEIECEYISNTIRPNEKRTRVVAQPNFHFDECKADSRLIAAAPRLYDAAQRYVGFHEESCVHGNMPASEIIAEANTAFQYLKAALAEAAGESEVE